MAAFTSKAAGDWSSSGATTWTQAGVPGSGDTVTISHAITVSSNTTIGSSPNTGGTAAITFGAAGGLINQTSGTMTIQGDVTTTATTTGSLDTWTMASGTSIVFSPPSGQQYVWRFNGAGTLYTRLICNGLVGSHCSITTDKSSGGLSSYMTVQASHQDCGVVAAAYTDFSNFADSTHWGVQSFFDAIAGDTTHALTISNCTFTACSWNFNSGGSVGGHAWDQNFTFTNNKFISSVTNTLSGRTAAIQLFFSVAASIGTRTIRYNATDCTITFPTNSYFVSTFSDNIINATAGLGIAAPTLTWTTAANCARNLIIFDSTTANTSQVSGAITDWYFYNLQTSNPHTFSLTPKTATTNYDVRNCIFESPSTTSTGEAIFTNTATFPTGSTAAIIGNIIIPSSNGKSPHSLLSAQAAGIAITAEHNTVPGHSESASLVYYGETVVGIAGTYVSVRSNIVNNIGSDNRAYVLADANVSTLTADVLAVPNGTTTFGAGYNSIYNASTGSCLLNSVATSTVGYNNVKCSTAAPFPNTQIGFSDNTNDPQFVDGTRSLASWGGTAAGGGVATAAGAMAAIAANPLLIGQATTGLLAWVRAGFRPTNSAFQTSSYPGDTSTVDAGGNSWPGGSPGRGAMAYFTTASSSTANDGPPYPIFADGPTKSTPSGWI